MDTEQAGAGRFEVVVEEGPPHGDLYELEQTTYYHVVERASGEVVLTFRSDMEASLSRESGVWEGHRFSGVCAVTIDPGEEWVVVRYCDGTEERVGLP